MHAAVCFQCRQELTEQLVIIDGRLRHRPFGELAHDALPPTEVSAACMSPRMLLRTGPARSGPGQARPDSTGAALRRAGS
jgi:hypothetical protein